MNIVIVGAGLAAANVVEELREQGHDGPLTVVGAEKHLPYERPPLSKSVLLGTSEPDSVFVHDRGWYDDHEVDLRLGAAAQDIDLDRQQITAGGSRIPYDRLLLATGASPRRLPVFEDQAFLTLYLRTIEDAVALKSKLAGRVLIIGAGWIGLEVAAAAREAGASVTIVETAAQPLLAALGPEIASMFADLHREHGVDLRLSTSVSTITGSTVHLSDGTAVNPHLVLVGIGAVPQDHLARNAGLAVDNGILVDAELRANDPHVFAAGDVANHDHPTLGRVRVEHWDTAIQHGKHVARSMLGDGAPYTRQPYFFTDQYDLGMEYIGHIGPGGYDEVVIRGDRSSRNLNALWIKQNRIVAGLHLNDWDATEHLRRLVGAEMTDLATLRDTARPLEALEPTP